MADNFNLREFLTENKLTKNAQLLKENWQVTLDSRPVDIRSIEVDGIDPADRPDFSDAYITYAEFEDGTPLTEEELMRLEDENYGIVNDLIHDRQLDMDESKKETMEEVEEAYQPKSKLEQVIQAAWAERDINKAKQLVIDLIEPSRINSKQQILDTIKGINNKGRLDQYLANSLLKFEKLGLSESEEVEEGMEPKETVKENTMTERDKYLTRLVENALGFEVTEDYQEEGYGDDSVISKLEKRGEEIPERPTYSEGDEMVEEKPLPKYEKIEKLMQEIDKSTDEEAHKFKMQEMKRVADMLEKKCTGLEEGDDADHIDQKKLKQMKKDIMTLRKGIEKMEKVAEKKFTKKETKAELKEGFDLRKFLVENKLTTNSKMLSENVNLNEEHLLSSFRNPETGITLKDMQNFINKTSGTYIYNYFEPVDGVDEKIEVTPEQAFAIVKAMNGKGEIPDSLPQGYDARLYFRYNN